MWEEFLTYALKRTLNYLKDTPIESIKDVLCSKDCYCCGYYFILSHVCVELLARLLVRSPKPRDCAIGQASFLTCVAIEHRALHDRANSVHYLIPPPF